MIDIVIARGPCATPGGIYLQKTSVHYLPDIETSVYQLFDRGIRHWHTVAKRRGHVYAVPNIATGCQLFRLLEPR